jgi:hypothetical protein
MGRDHGPDPCTGKSQKVAGNPANLHPHPSKKNRFRIGGRLRKTGILPPHCTYLNFDYIYTMYNDLTVRNGRLINNRPNDVTGIQQAAQIKKDLKREQKIQMMSEAIYRGEMMSDLEKSLMERKKK